MYTYGGMVGTVPRVPYGTLIQNGSIHGGTVGTYLHSPYSTLRQDGLWDSLYDPIIIVHTVYLDRMDGGTVGTIPHSPTSTLRQD